MSSFPATNNSGCFSGCNSNCLAIHWPSKWAYHHPFFRLSLSCWEGRIKGTLKYLCAGCSSTDKLVLRGGGVGAMWWAWAATTEENIKLRRVTQNGKRIPLKQHYYWWKYVHIFVGDILQWCSSGTSTTCTKCCEYSLQLNGNRNAYWPACTTSCGALCGSPGPVGVCFLFFIVHAWDTLNCRWNSSRQASKRSIYLKERSSLVFYWYL